MSSKPLNFIVALKFADDFGKFIMKYYNVPWKSLSLIFPAYDLEDLPSIYEDYIGMVSLRSKVLRMMYNNTKSCSSLLLTLNKVSPFEGLLLFKRRLQTLLTSDKISFFVVCALVLKTCHALILSGKNEMVYVPLVALADLIVEESLIEELESFSRYGLAILASKVSPEVFETYAADEYSEDVPLNLSSTFWR